MNTQSTAAAAGTTNPFDALLGELDTLQKSFPAAEGGEGGEGAGDEKIRAAAGAAAGGAAAKAGTEESDEDKAKKAAAAAAAAGGAGAAAVEDPPLTKSFEFTDAEGNKVQAVDAGPALAALQAQVAATEAGVAKFMGGMVTMMKSLVAENGKLVTSINEMRGDGRGRKAVLALNGADGAGGAGTGKEPDGMTSEDFFTKAIALQSQGLISGQDIARCEAYINRGMQPPEDVVRKVVAAAAK